MIDMQAVIITCGLGAAYFFLVFLFRVGCELASLLKPTTWGRK